MYRRAAVVLHASLLAGLLGPLACRTAAPAVEAERVSRRDRGLAARSGPYEIAPWFRFHRAACSLTFDDGTLDQYLVAFPALEERGLKATFFVVTGPRAAEVWHDQGADRRLFGWDQAREMARAGHEIGSHSASHRDLSLPGAPIAAELAGSLALLARELRQQAAVALAWPFWRSVADAKAAAARAYLGARSGTAFAEAYVERGVPPATPRDLYDVNSFAALASATDEEWAAAAGYVLWRRGWLVADFHGVDDGSIDREALGWEALPLERFRRTLDWLDAQDLWIAPFGRVVRYIRERDRARLVRDREEEALVAVRLLDGLDNRVYDQALSVRIPLPPGWSDARVVQDGVEMPSAVGGGVLEFDARPNGTSVRIERVRKP